MAIPHRATLAEISSLLGLSEKNVRRYIALFEQTGDVRPVSRRNGLTKLLGDCEQLMLLKFIIERPGIYVYEIKDRLEQSLGVTVSTSTICRTLQFVECSRQAIRHVAIQQSDTMRAKFMAEVHVSMYDPAMPVWIDESGCDRRNSIRKYGYSVKGIPPVEHMLLVRGTRYSAIPVMSIAGIHDVYLAEGHVCLVPASKNYA